ncbi:unknown [Bacteroides sp. CAG:530]|nr:unknown [Bacteroides sp. CAG:530]
MKELSFFVPFFLRYTAIYTYNECNVKNDFETIKSR